MISTALRLVHHSSALRVSSAFPTAYTRSPSVFWRSLTQKHDQSKSSAEDIMNMAANRATRFVYLRTLPLVKQPELEEEVKLIVDQIEDGTRRLCEKHLSTVIDDRAAVHLHTTALAIATHRVLSPRIKNEIRLSNIIRSGFGAETLPEASSSEEHKKEMETSAKTKPDFWIVRAALWFSFDRMASVRRMTENMVKDFGSTFETSYEDEVVDGRKHHSLFVSKYLMRPILESKIISDITAVMVCPKYKSFTEKCYYNELCRSEGVPHLTNIFCALDKAIYAPITTKSHGINFTLDKTLANQTDGDSTDNRCEFRFVQHK